MEFEFVIAHARIDDGETVYYRERLEDKLGM